jgi:hypothetical protein
MSTENYSLISRLELSGFRRRQEFKQKNIHQVLDLPASGGLEQVLRLPELTSGELKLMLAAYWARFKPLARRPAFYLTSLAVVFLLVVIATLASVSGSMSAYDVAHRSAAKLALVSASNASGKVNFSYRINNPNDFTTSYNCKIITTSASGTSVVASKKVKLAAGASKLVKAQASAGKHSKLVVSATNAPKVSLRISS